MAKKAYGRTALGTIRSSPPGGAQGAFMALQGMRKSHYSGECYSRGSSGEMDMRRLSTIHSSPAPTQGKRSK